MSVNISWSKVAQTNLGEIIKFYFATTDPHTTNLMARRLNAEVDLLARNPLFGHLEPQYGTEFKVWKLLDKQYNLFFKRPNLNTLRVVMLRSTSEPLPTLAELRKANK
jgi:plasmid stabilization system protein ParE